MIIYHGSKNIIESPEYNKGKKYNDYGLGFYCTENIDLAKEWAVDIGQNGYANKYELNCADLITLDLCSDKYNMLNWLAILLENRQFTTTSPLAKEAKEYIIDNFMIDYKNYDIIIGYRADDSYFSFASDFISGTISYRQLGNAMRLGKLETQVVLKRKKAFDTIKYIGNETALEDAWYAKKEIRDKTARNEYSDSERNKREKGDIYITAILDEEMKQDDSRLR